jgi:subtilisin family serine protease
VTFLPIRRAAMKRRLLGTALLALSAACADRPPSATDPGTRGEPAPLYLAEAGEGVAGQFIVVLHDDGDPVRLAGAAGIAPGHVYRHTLRGFSAQLSAEQVEAVRRTAGVAWVEQDQVVSAAATDSVPSALWGLDRLDQRQRPLSRTITYTHTGEGVNVYVFDSGIRMDHAEFATDSGPRAVFAYDVYGTGGADCSGHGTRIAGVIGGREVGVARGARLHSVKLLGCDNRGENSDLIAAIDWLRVNRVMPAVANLSLTGPYTKAVNEAVDRLFSAGILPIIAAGNQARSACGVSPASAVKSFTVAASDSLDARATFSNWGRCVSLYAPGVAIFSSMMDGGYASGSGTSLSAPFVAGVAAMYLQKNPTHSPTQLRNFLLQNATASVIRFNDSGTVMYGTPNLLLFTAGL